jgi:uncharacterized repeat protein (TIGR04076 family)
MAKPCDVLVRVVSQKGHCDAGHKVGDEFIVGAKTPEGLCSVALHSIFPFFRVLRFGGSHPWQSDPDVIEAVPCPDQKNPALFELRRLYK